MVLTLRWLKKESCLKESWNRGSSLDHVSNPKTCLKCLVLLPAFTRPSIMATTKQVSNKVKQRTQYFKSYLQGKMPIGTKLPTSLLSIFKVTSIAQVVLNNFWTWDVAQLIECFLNLYKVLGSTLNTNKTGCRSKGLNSHTLGMS